MNRGCLQKWNMTTSFFEIPSRVLSLVLRTRVRILECQISLPCTLYWSKGRGFLHYANSLHFAEYRWHTTIYDGDHLIRLCTHNSGTPIPCSITSTKWTTMLPLHVILLCILQFTEISMDPFEMPWAFRGWRGFYVVPSHSVAPTLCMGHHSPSRCQVVKQ